MFVAPYIIGFSISNMTSVDCGKQIEICSKVALAIFGVKVQKSTANPKMSAGELSPQPPVVFTNSGSSPINGFTTNRL